MLPYNSNVERANVAEHPSGFRETADTICAESMTLTTSNLGVRLDCGLTQYIFYVPGQGVLCARKPAI